MSPSKKPGASKPLPSDPVEPDLFSTAPAHEDGYAFWRAEQEKERRAMPVHELPVSEQADGYVAWRAEMQRNRETVEKRFGVPLGHRVRVQLINELKPLEGLLCVVEERQGPRAKGLRLRVGDRSFMFGEIESVVAV